MSANSLASLEYLESLPGTTFRRLYQQPSTALAIFRRMLPHLAKTFVMAMLYMSKPFLLSDIDLWMRPDSRRSAIKDVKSLPELTTHRKRDDALAVLQRLHIITISAPSRDDPQVVTLTKNFRASLRLALTGGGDHQSFGVPSNEADTGDVDIDFLDNYARMQWEGILHYVVNSAGGGQGASGQGPTNDVKKLLEAGRLVSKGRHSSGITQQGFSFLLQETNAQVWTLLLLWINNAEQMQMDSVEVLSFFFMLGSLDLGRAYSSSTLTEPQQRMLSHLVDFGLMYIPPSSPTQFFPTRLATTLTSDASAIRSVSAGFSAATAAPSGSKGFIIIETNYRLYAYTNSPLQIAVLALFTKLSSRYPNMVSGRVTRQSVYSAIAQGITSDQIISYLSSHAHPQLVKAVVTKGGGPVLPPTVVDQIRLWQIENERMKATPGFLFRDFDTAKEYDACAKYADENGLLVWKNDTKRMFFVTRHEQLRDYIKSRKMK